MVWLALCAAWLTTSFWGCQKKLIILYLPLFSFVSVSRIDNIAHIFLDILVWIIKQIFGGIINTDRAYCNLFHVTLGWCHRVLTNRQSLILSKSSCVVKKLVTSSQHYVGQTIVKLHLEGILYISICFGRNYFCKSTIGVWSCKLKQLATRY